MADSNASWSRNSNIVNIDPNEKLFLFGYSCKIFRDDEKAKYIDEGKHLIPWMGDESVMIDRYDARGYLNDLSQFETSFEPFSHDDPLEEEEERLCEEERYRSLRTEVTQEQLYQEEEMKRLQAAVASDGAYHEIGFSYDSSETNPNNENTEKVDEPEDELYDVPEGLELPKDMEVPSNMKIHSIIEKTAMFISEQGGQMEIIIKMKQQDNPQFAFMHLDNLLYPYYKHLVTVIKSGAYRPVQTKKVSHSEDEDDGDHYLHPSLLSGKTNAAPTFTVPTINFRRSSDDSYSVLVRNLKPQLDEVKATEAENVPESETVASDAPAEFLVVQPPPDLQPVIDKMAEYVVKNGEDFETIVKAKNDIRFDFLNPWCEYYNYYINKRNSIKLLTLGDEPAQSKPVVKESGPVLYNTEPTPTPESVPPTQSSLVPTVPTQQEAEAQPPVIPAVRTKKSKKQKRLIPTVPTREEAEALIPTVPTREEAEAMIPTVPTREEAKAKLKKALIPTVPTREEAEEQPKKRLRLVEFSDGDTTDSEQEENSEDKKGKGIGPICFTLKPRETDSPIIEKTKLQSLVLLGCSDSEDEKENSQESTSSSKKNDEQPPAADPEVKTEKPNTEVSESKQAEERIKDKLVATVRERLALQRKESQIQQEREHMEEKQKKDKQLQLEQQRKDKQLQMERKKKAALFLQMLAKKNSGAAVVSHVLENQSTGQPNWNGPKTLPGIPAASSDSESSQHSGEAEPITVMGEASSEDDKEDKTSSKILKKKLKKKKKKRSKSPTPTREKRAKKELPAAYAINNETEPHHRSRSRSPPRRYHRPPFPYWERRR